MALQGVCSAPLKKVATVKLRGSFWELKSIDQINIHSSASVFSEYIARHCIMHFPLPDWKQGLSWYSKYEYKIVP